MPDRPRLRRAAFRHGARGGGLSRRRDRRHDCRIGGSKTIDQIGLYDRLTRHNTVWWHWRTPGFDTLDHALTAPVYLSSANAITEDGQILNIDGRGNRLAAMVYGIGKTVYIVAGTNKICRT